MALLGGNVNQFMRFSFLIEGDFCCVFFVVCLFLFSVEKFSQATGMAIVGGKVYTRFFYPNFIGILYVLLVSKKSVHLSNNYCTTYSSLYESIILPICLFLFVSFSLKVGWEK